MSSSWRFSSWETCLKVSIHGVELRPHIDPLGMQPFQAVQSASSVRTVRISSSEWKRGVGAAHETAPFLRTSLAALTASIRNVRVFQIAPVALPWVCGLATVGPRISAKLACCTRLRICQRAFPAPPDHAFLLRSSLGQGLLYDVSHWAQLSSVGDAA